MTLTNRTLESRLRNIELQNRCLYAMLLLLLAAILVAATGEEAIPDVVRARAFYVVGDDGKPLVKLEDSFGEGNGWAGTIETFNRDGLHLLILSASKEGLGSLRTLNGKAQTLVHITSTPDGAGRVETQDGKGEVLVELGARADGPGAVVTHDPRGLEGRGVHTTRP